MGIPALNLAGVVIRFDGGVGTSGTNDRKGIVARRHGFVRFAQRMSGGGYSGVVASLGLVGGMRGYQHHHGFAGIAQRDEGIVARRLAGIAASWYHGDRSTEGIALSSWTARRL